MAHVNAVDEYGSALHVIETRNELGDGGFACSRRTDESDKLTWFDAESDVTKHEFFRGFVRCAMVGDGKRFERGQRNLGSSRVTKRDVGKRNSCATRRHRDCIRLFLDHWREIEHFEYSLERNKRGHDADLNVR